MSTSPSRGVRPPARFGYANRRNSPQPIDPIVDSSKLWCCPVRELVASRREARRGFGEPIPPRRLLVRPGDTGSRSGQRLFIGDTHPELKAPPVALHARTHDTVVMHRLFILRHAKAATHPPMASAGDHDRPLAGRGVAVLPGVARSIVGQLDGQPLDLVLCSTSTRTRETVELVAQSEPAVAAAPLKLDRKLYLADPARLLKTLRKVPDDVATVLLCGHNPGLHQLALFLLGDDGSQDAAEQLPPRLRYDLPTAGLVVVDLDGSWTSVGTGRASRAAKLRAFVVPSDA